MTRTDRDLAMALICERIRQQTEWRLHSDAGYGISMPAFEDDGRASAAVLKALQEAIPGPWPEEKPQVKCWLDGSVLRTQFTMQAGPAADQLARAGVDVRCADGTPYVPMDEEIVITVKETER